MAYVTTIQKRQARRADLYDFLAAYHPDDFYFESGCLRFKYNHSISIKQGYCGYYDFGTGEKGNSIDFLEKYMGYSFTDAALALNHFYSGDNVDVKSCAHNSTTAATTSSPKITIEEIKLMKLKNQLLEDKFYEDAKKVMGSIHNDALIRIMAKNKKTEIMEKITALEQKIKSENNELLSEIPKPSPYRYKRLFAYLQNRGININLIKHLIDEKLLYEEEAHGNIVFVNPTKTFAELRGTLTYGKRFHGVAGPNSHGGFWAFKNIKGTQKPDKAYVCESAIDAMSLYLLHLRSGIKEPAYYISIAGATKQAAIDRIKSVRTVIIAVDNDSAGRLCRERNDDCEYIIPTHKDWNEDLRAMIGR